MMSTQQASAFFLFAVVAAITPGPSNLLLAATGASVGLVRGLPSLWGVTLGMGLLMVLVALGLGSLVLESPPLVHGLKWGGSGFLLWLSWKITTAKRSPATGEYEVVGFWRAATLQWVNPKSWLVSLSAVGTYLQAEAGSVLLQSLAFGALFVLAALPSCGLWLAFGATLQRLLCSVRAWRVFSIGMGALLAGSVVLFLWQ